MPSQARTAKTRDGMTVKVGVTTPTDDGSGREGFVVNKHGVAVLIYIPTK